MRQLSGPDAFHLLAESADQPMHTVKVAIVDTSQRPLSIDELRSWVTDRVRRIGPLRWTLIHVPLGLGKPYWVDAHEVDLAHHVDAVELGARGAPTSLDDYLAEVAAAPLDRTRPLWRLHLVTGFAAGQAALVLQLHHAVADGLASVHLWEALSGDVAEIATPAPAPPADRRTIVAHAVRHQIDQARRFPSQWRRFLAYVQGSRDLESDASKVTKAFAGPATAFNEPVVGPRACAFVTVPLADVRAASKHLGGTVNDVFLTLCGGALGRYLDERGGRPSESITAVSPVSVDRDPDAFGNAVTTWYLSLHSTTDDPAERLHAVQASVAATRTATARDPALLPDWQAYAVANRAVVLAMQVIERQKGRPAFNVTVSNVRGPADLELVGRPVLHLRSLGPLTGRLGLNLTAWSYRDEFVVGLHGTRSATPDLDVLGALLVDELARMQPGADAPGAEPDGAPPADETERVARPHGHPAPRQVGPTS